MHFLLMWRLRYNWIIRSKMASVSSCINLCVYCTARWQIRQTVPIENSPSGILELWIRTKLCRLGGLAVPFQLESTPQLWRWGLERGHHCYCIQTWFLGEETNMHLLILVMVYVFSAMFLKVWISAMEFCCFHNTEFWHDSLSLYRHSFKTSFVPP